MNRSGADLIKTLYIRTNVRHYIALRHVYVCVCCCNQWVKSQLEFYTDRRFCARIYPKPHNQYVAHSPRLQGSVRAPGVKFSHESSLDRSWPSLHPPPLFSPSTKTADSSARWLSERGRVVARVGQTLYKSDAVHGYVYCLMALNRIEGTADFAGRSQGVNVFYFGREDEERLAT